MSVSSPSVCVGQTPLPPPTLAALPPPGLRLMRSFRFGSPCIAFPNVSFNADRECERQGIFRGVSFSSSSPVVGAVLRPFISSSRCCQRKRRVEGRKEQPASPAGKHGGGSGVGRGRQPASQAGRQIMWRVGVRKGQPGSQSGRQIRWRLRVWKGQAARQAGS